jgi:TPR repeat protein
LAVAYQNGFGVRVDAQRAAEVRRRACEEMEGEGCDLGRPLAIHGASPRHGPGGAWSTATGSYEACKNGAITACVSLASFYEAGAGVRRDGREAFRLFEQACEAGDAKGCFHLAYMVHHGIATVASSNQARGLYRKACRGGVREACAFSKD